MIRMVGDPSNIGTRTDKWTVKIKPDDATRLRDASNFFVGEVPRMGFDRMGI
jgi:hypothetical protein